MTTSMWLEARFEALEKTLEEFLASEERHRAKAMANEERPRVAKEDWRKLKEDITELKEMFAIMFKDKMVEGSGEPSPPSRE